MDFKVGDKVQAVDTIRRHWVLQMKKGQQGTIEAFTEVYDYYGSTGRKITPCAIVKLKSDRVEVPLEALKPYEKKVREVIETLDNEALLNKYERLTLDEQHANSINTKSYQKILRDIDKAKTEILKRMNK